MTIVTRSILAISLAAAFLVLASIGGPSNHWDTTVASWFGQLRTDIPEVARLAAFFTIVGGAPATLGISLAAALWLLAKRMGRRALLLAAVVLLTRLSVELMKAGFGRPRPSLDHLPASLAFPSGHAANSMTAFMAVALLAVPDRYRRAAVFAALALTFAVGATRIVLGVHWASDVLGGWILGILTVGVAVTISERSDALRLEAQHDVVARHGSSVRED